MDLQIAEFVLKSERDVNWAGQRSRLLASLAGFRQKQRTAFGKATTAVARKAVRMAGTGTITFGLAMRDRRQIVEAAIRCQNKGVVQDGTEVDVVPPDRVLLDAEVRTLVDFVDERTDPDVGTTVRIGMFVSADADIPSEDAVSEWGTVLATRTTQGALATSQQRIRELGERLQEMQQRGGDMQQELDQIRTLNETLELLALVASKTENAVIILDAAGQIEWVNDGFTRMTGSDLKDIRGIPFREVLRGLGADQATIAEIRDALASGHGLTREVRYQLTSGETTWASLSVTPVFNEEGATTHWIGIGNDVTQRHQAEEQLRIAKEAAETTSQTKSVFLANMSHEIRTPMNAIIGMTELTLDSELSAEQRDNLTTVKRSAAALLNLLNDILDLSKIEAGKLAIDPHPFRLSDSLHDMLRPYSIQAQRKGLRFVMEIEPETPDTLFADATRLRQIMTNLVANAIKFSSSGEIRVHVEPQWQTESETNLHFSVTDSGIGISADKLDSIFESFTQADSSTTRQHGGTGLGLTISRQLLDLMDGRMWVESELGRGSTFHFNLRMRLADDCSVAEAESAVSQTVEREPVTQLQVLVADDNPANRTLAARILEKRGHAVRQVNDGPQILAALAETKFDAVLMDVQMPGMDGFTCTRQIRASESEGGERLPIVAVTAYAMRGDREKCLDAGMDGYVAKPLDARELIATVESLASGSAALPEVAVAVSPGTARDFSHAIGRLEGDVELFREQAEFFLNDSPTLVDRIRQSLAERDASELHIAAHRIKGLAAGFDATEVVAAALELEQLGSMGTIDGADDPFYRLRDELAALRDELEAYLASDTAQSSSDSA